MIIPLSQQTRLERRFQKLRHGHICRAGIAHSRKRQADNEQQQLRIA